MAKVIYSLNIIIQRQHPLRYSHQDRIGNGKRLHETYDKVLIIEDQPNINPLIISANVMAKQTKNKRGVPHNPKTLVSSLQILLDLGKI